MTKTNTRTSLAEAIEDRTRLGLEVFAARRRGAGTPAALVRYQRAVERVRALEAACPYGCEGFADDDSKCDGCLHGDRA